jgi:hypothetical protein
LARFAVAFMISSFAVFALAGALGAVMSRALPAAPKLVAVCLVLGVALALDGYSLRRKTWCPVTARRQTPKSIQYQYGMHRAAVAWGLDTGLVFTTYRMSSICWALLTLGLLGATPWWAGLGYAAGFLVPLVAGCTLSAFREGDDATTALSGSLLMRTSIARTTCVAALAAAVITAAAQFG